MWFDTWQHLEPQLEEDDEVILVDGSVVTESSGGWSIPFESERIRLRVLMASKKRGNRLNSLRNLGIEEAKNDPILLIDPGCIPAPDLLANARSLFDPGVVFGAQVDFFQEDERIAEDPRLTWKRDLQENPWVDEYPDEANSFWSDCLLFGKERTGKIGWFSEDNKGQQTPGDQDFVEKCYHSGLRLKYEVSLRVSRRVQSFEEAREQINAPKVREGDAHLLSLPSVSPYRPEVFVLVVAMLRPYYLDECLQRIFQNITPLKVCLVNQGDNSEEMLKALKKWTPRWVVDYVYNEHPRSMAEVRSEAFTWAKQQGYDYAVTIDDDMLVKPGALDELVKTARENPQFHAIAGYCIEPDRVRLLGGREKVIGGRCYRFNLPYTRGLTEVDFISSGLRIVRLEPLILQDTEYDFGWIDWDYSKRIRKESLRLAVTGEVGGYHGMMQVDGKWQAKPDPEAYASIRLDEDRMERMTQLFENKWDLKLGRGIRPLSYRLLSRLQWDLGTIYYRGINLYKRMRPPKGTPFVGSLKTQADEAAGQRRSRLETYVDVLRALSEGVDSLKGLSLAAGISKGELLGLLRDMLSQGIVTESDIESNKDGVNFKFTEKGMNVLGYFTRMRDLPPHQKA